MIVGVQATAARMSQETVAAQDMLTRFAQWQGQGAESVAADTTYGNGEFLQWLVDRSITPYMRTRDSIHRKNSPFYGPERFTYQPELNRYICPAGQPLNYGGQFIGTEPTTTSGSASVAGHARKNHNAPVQLFGSTDSMPIKIHLPPEAAIKSTSSSSRSRMVARSTVASLIAMRSERRQLFHRELKR